MKAAAGLLAAKFALGPVLLPQSKWLKRNALRLPEAAGPREGKVGVGEPVLRLLVVGDSSAAGVGVADQAQALVLQAALKPADLVVTALGVNDVGSQNPAHRFIEQMALLWSELQQRTGARWAVVSGLPPMHLLTAVPHPLRWYLGRYAALLDTALHRWTKQQ